MVDVDVHVSSHLKEELADKRLRVNYFKQVDILISKH